MIKKNITINANKNPIAKDFQILYNGKQLRNIVSASFTFLDIENKNESEKEMWRLAGSDNS